MLSNNSNYMLKNKKAIISTACLFGFIFNVPYSSAEYIAKFPLEGLTAVSNLIDYAPLYSDWSNIGSTQNCTEWLPLANGIKSGESFNQSANCEQPQERTVQQRKQNTKTNEIVNYGNTTKESQNIKVSITQSAVGTGVSGAGCVPVGSDWG